MVACNILLIFSFTTSFCTVIARQIINEHSRIIIEESVGTFCKNPEDFPLFGTDSCISPSVYTALFLTSIILAGITFLMIIGVLIFLCIRCVTRSYSKYHHNADPSIPEFLHNDNNNQKIVTSHPKSDKEISNVLRKIVSNSPLEGLSQTHIHHSFHIPTAQDSFLSSYNSNIDTPSMEKSLQPINNIETISESYELTTRKSSQQSSVNRNDSINSYEYNRKYSTKL